MSSMKAITIRQPLANLISYGGITYETRNWKTHYRGYIAIHTASTWYPDEAEIWQDMVTIFRQKQMDIPETVSFGAIICICKVINCVPYEQIRDQLANVSTLFRNFSDGQYVWELKRVKNAAEPIQIRGKQGLWTWEYGISSKPKAFLSIANTGEDEQGRICEIGMVDEEGEILLNTVVNPQVSIPPIASARHSITDRVVHNAPTIADLCEQILALFGTYDVYAYDTDLSTRLLWQSHDALTHLNTNCMMSQFASVYGQWDDYLQDYRPQSLAKACNYYDIRNAYPNRALGDAFASRQVWLAMNKGCHRDHEDPA